MMQEYVLEKNAVRQQSFLTFCLSMSTCNSDSSCLSLSIICQCCCFVRSSSSRSCCTELYISTTDRQQTTHCAALTVHSLQTYRVEQKNGASLSRCKYSENSMTELRENCSDVNKDLTFKAKDKDKDQTLKAKDQDKDQTPKDKDKD